MPVGLAGDLKKCLAHRHAGDFSIAEVLRGLLEVDRRAGNLSRHHAIGEAGHYVRFERQGRSSFQNRRQHGRAGSISAYSDHNIGLKFSQDAARIPDGAGKIE